METARPILGIDIGGTKTAAGVVAADGRVLSYLRQPTPQSAGAADLLAFVVALAGRAVAAAGVAPLAAGVGCGGPMHYPAGIVSPLHIPAWRDFPLRDRLAAALGLPTIVDNDAKAFALGEAIFGAGAPVPPPPGAPASPGQRVLLGMVVSTGVGAGIVANGALAHGRTGNAGHIGHVIVAPRGLRCECGALGCLTPYASGTGLAARTRAAIASGAATGLATLPPAGVTAEAIAAHAAAGDLLARRLLADAGTMIGRAIASAAAILDFDLVVLGGGVAQSGPPLFDPLRSELRRRAHLPFTRDLRVTAAGLGPTSGVIGAAALARHLAA